MSSRLKGIVSAGFLLGGAIAILQLVIDSFDRELPLSWLLLEYYSFPGKVFLVMLGDSAPILSDPKNHVWSICFWTSFAIFSNAVLYACIASLLYFAAVLVKKIRGGAKRR
jgi:hypothetical protein